MVIVKVETVSGSKVRQMLTMPDGSREFIQSEDWTRKAAKEALELLEQVYGFKRSSVRFQVH